MTDSKPERPEVGINVANLIRLFGETMWSDPCNVMRGFIINAHDALLARDPPELYAQRDPPRVSIRIDRDLNRILVQDNGFGIAPTDLTSVFGKVGKAMPGVPVGRFGLGFLSGFLIADTIEVLSTPLDSSSTGVHAVFDAKSGTQTITSSERASESGTLVILHLNSRCEDLLLPGVVESVVAELSESLRFPVLVNERPVRQTSYKHGGDGLRSEVERILQAADFKFLREPSIGGLRPDFAVVGPSGRLIVIEAKSGPARPDVVSRAVAQAEYLKSATGAHHSLVVFAGIGERSSPPNIVSPADLPQAILDALAGPGSDTCPKSTSKVDKTVFAAMPFDDTYDDVFFVAMAYAAEQIGATCIRVDHEEFSGDVVTELLCLIRKSAAVIVDLSESRPNVLFEAGYAHALRIPCVHICSTALNDLPFDVRNFNTMSYEQGRTSRLREPLAARLLRAITRR